MSFDKLRVFSIDTEPALEDRPEMIYYKFLKEMIEALKDGKMGDDFTGAEFAENLEIMTDRFSSFLPQVEEIDAGDSEQGTSFQSDVLTILQDQVSVLQELKSYPDAIDYERAVQLLEVFRDSCIALVTARDNIDSMAAERGWNNMATGEDNL